MQTLITWWESLRSQRSKGRLARSCNACSSKNATT